MDDFIYYTFILVRHRCRQASHALPRTRFWPPALFTPPLLFSFGHAIVAGNAALHCLAAMYKSNAQIMHILSFCYRHANYLRHDAIAAEVICRCHDIFTICAGGGHALCALYWRRAFYAQAMLDSY